MVFIRKGGVIFGLVLGLVFVKPGDLALFVPSLTEVALSFIGASINVLVLLGVVILYHNILPSLFSKEWHMPHQRISPFLVWSEPVNFFHFCGVVFTSAGISSFFITAVFATVPMLIPLQILSLGLGTLLGIKVVPYVFPGRIKYFNIHV